MIEFVLPTVKDDLLKSVPGQFNVEEVLSSRLIPVKLQGKAFFELEIN